ncbi:DUF397 domain-containing protein [Kitasatospora sp. NPDC097691]
MHDSMDPDGLVLVFTAPAWEAFITAVRTGDLPA